jgi:hypothetical protein
MKRGNNMNPDATWAGILRVAKAIQNDDDAMDMEDNLAWMILSLK